MAHGYRCPSCRTTNALHREGCRHENTETGAIEKAHTDILSVLSLTRRSEDGLKDAVHNGWSPLNQAVLELYESEGRIVRRPADEDGDEEMLYLRTPEEYRAQLVPTEAHIETVWQHGPTDGCKDVAVISIVSWHEWRDFDWEETCQRVADWLRDTGAWDSGSWEESSIEELLEDKRHVFENSYGWKKAAQEAESVIQGRASA